MNKTATLVTVVSMLISGSAAAELERYTETIPGTAESFEMVRVPGGTLEVTDEDGSVRQVEVAPFHMSPVEVTWDLYDLFVFRLDLPEDRRESDLETDAETRPTQPYLMADRGWGHHGYPALSTSAKAAESYVAWLRAKTGKPYRLPTEAEWEWAARAGTSTRWHWGDDEERLEEYAWYRSNSKITTHPVGTKAANPFGLFDLEGNVSEWVVRGEGVYVLAGGCYEDRARTSEPTSRKIPSKAWNQRDPQLPKSVWWLADASFAGLRVVCDIEAAEPTEDVGQPVEEDGGGFQVPVERGHPLEFV